MKQLAIILFLFVSVVGCKKKEDINPKLSENDVSNVNDVSTRCQGTYTCTVICKTWTLGSAYIYDTTYNVSIKVERMSDSILSIGGNNNMTFSGDLDAKIYSYKLPTGLHDGGNSTFSSDFSKIDFVHYWGGNGGGTSCSYKGNRQ